MTAQSAREIAAHLECAWLAPYDNDDARAHSAYYGYHDGDLVRLLETASPTPFARVAHAAFRTFVLDERFPCLGARAALHRGTYRFGTYERLDDDRVMHGLMRDLYAFVAERDGMRSDFTSFIAVFREQVRGGERGFEHALWSQLQRLHQLDRRFHDWDHRVCKDPADPNFSFSLAGNAFFIVGMHPRATRRARRFGWPTLAFNAHEQFETLRADGRFPRLRERIRERDIALQGSLNGNLTDYGQRSEARQYAGRRVEEAWRCPFRPTG